MSTSWRAILLFLVGINVLIDASRVAANPGQAQENIFTLKDDAISCLLHEGDTTLIISLAGSSTRDRFTFINENSTARGELRIAVATEKLSPDSDKWTPVDGAISFKRKRLFNVSILGVEAKYVRLTFHVEPDRDIAAAGRALVSR
ncbi:MAG: hypothetical protein DMF04_05795 [Verrucomicrobia bacterium]|jgi:hypothetical protein|nr:MAG: hypothetical protein DMF04_05795 [Verrucomicrobiota bacterium]